MPVVSCSKERLLERVGKQLSDDDVDQLCFDVRAVLLHHFSQSNDEREKGAIFLNPFVCSQYGLELDAVATADDTASSSFSSSATIYRIEVPANRHDLLCVEVCRSLPLSSYSLFAPS